MAEGKTWQQVAAILMLIAMSAGGVTYTDILGTLFQLKGIDYTHSGNTTGKEAFINTTTSYWRVCFEHTDPDQSIIIPGKTMLFKTTMAQEPDTVLYKKSSFGRTLWVNLNNVDSIISTSPKINVSWQVPTYGNKWRDLQDGDCWDRGKVNKIKLVADKEPWQTVKWGFNIIEQNSSYVEIDPVWEGKPTLVEEEVIIEYLEMPGEWLGPGGEDDNFLDDDYAEPTYEPVIVTKQYWLYETSEYFIKIPDDVHCVSHGSDQELQCDLTAEIKYYGNNKTVDDLKADIVFEKAKSITKELFVDKEKQELTATAIDKKELKANKKLEEGDHNITFNFKYPMFTQDKINITLFDIVIDPEVTGCMKINTSNDIYYMTGDLTELKTSNCLSVDPGSVNVTIDCQGYTFDGNDVADHAVYGDWAAGGQAELTIQNCNFQDWDTRVFSFTDMENVTFRNIITTSNPDVVYWAYPAKNIVMQNVSFIAASGNAADITLANDWNVTDSYFESASAHVWDIYNFGSNFIVTNTVFEGNPFDWYVYPENTFYSTGHNWTNVTSGDMGWPIIVLTQDQNLTGGNYSEVLTDGDNNYIRDVVMCAPKGYGTQTSGGIINYGGNYVTVDNVSFSRCHTSVLWDWSQTGSVISNSYSEYPYSWHLYDDTLGDNSQVVNNTFYEQVSTSSYNIDSVNAGQNGWIISGNIFQDAPTNGFIEFVGASSGTHNYIYNNLFNYTGATTSYDWNDISDTGLNHANKTETDNFNRVIGEGYVDGNFYIHAVAGQWDSENCTDADTDGFCDGDTEELDLHPYSDEYTPFPVWSNPSTNSTITCEDVMHSMYWDAKVSFNMSGFIFSFDNGTGTMVNDSFVAFTDEMCPEPKRYCWSNVTKGISCTSGQTISWQVFANSTSGNMTASDVQQYINNNLPSLDKAELYPASPYSYTDLTINATCTDSDPDTLTIFWDIYKDDVLQAELAGNQTITSGVETEVFTIGAGNTSALEEWVAEIYCDDGIDPTAKQNSTTRTIVATYPQWSLNQTNNTDAGLSTLFSVYWTSNIVTLSGYIFGWHNGTNWTQTSMSADLETGTQSEEGAATSGSGVSFFETFDTLDNISASGDCGSYFYLGTSTPSGGTGPQNGDSDDPGTNFAYVESSAGYCDGIPSSGYLNYDNEIDWDAGINDNITFYTNMHGDSDLGTTIMEENSTGSWVQLGSYSQTGPDGNNGLVWTQYSIDASALTGKGYIRFYTYDHASFTGDSAWDWLNITSEGSDPDNETNKTAVEYLDISLTPYENLDNITVIVQVSYYNTSGSIAKGNNNATLWLEVYNGSDWIDEGDLGSGTTQVAQNYSVTVTTATVIQAWDSDSANRDIRISARNMDYNDTDDFDTINWTGVWVRENSNQEFINDSWVAMGGTANWSNITKTITTAVGATIKWYVYANSSDGVWNQTDVFQFITTTGAVTEKSINLSFGPDGVSVFRFATCGPDFENASAVPEGQNSSHGIDYLCNNGNDGAGDIQIKISGALNANWTWWASNSSISTDLINLTTDWQTIYGGLDEATCIYVWHVANCSYVHEGPGAYEQYQII